MSDKKKKEPSLLARIFASTKDAEPEELAEIAEEIMELAKADFPPADEQSAPPAVTPTDETPPNPVSIDGDILTKLTDTLATLNDTLQGVIQQQGGSSDPLDELLSESAGNGEESVTVEAEELSKDSDDITSPTETEPDDLPENPIPGADSALVAAVRAIKPIIAKLPESERRAAQDAAAAELRKALGVKHRDSRNQYAAIMKDRAKTKTNDSAAQGDPRELGKKIMADRNPHFKKKDGGK